MNFLMSHGHATRSTFIFSRVIHFISYSHDCGSLVLVRSRCCCALWCASNLYPDGGRSHWRRPRRLCSRSDRGFVDLDLSCIPLVSEPLGSKIESKRNFLFRAYWYLRRCRNNCILSTLPKRRSALFS